METENTSTRLRPVSAKGLGLKGTSISVLKTRQSDQNTQATSLRARTTEAAKDDNSQKRAHRNKKHKT